MQNDTDTQAIARVLAGLADGEIIDHGTARTIASQYSEPGICEAFVSTGVIPSGENGSADSFTLIHALFDGTAEDPELGLRAAKALERYIEDRNEAGDYGPVPGWSDMWVPKRPTSAGTEWMVRSRYTTTDGDRVTLLQKALYGKDVNTFAVSYSYEWPDAPQFIEYEDRTDAITAFVHGLHSAERRGVLARKEG